MYPNNAWHAFSWANNIMIVRCTLVKAITLDSRKTNKLISKTSEETYGKEARVSYCDIGNISPAVYMRRNETPV